jgi:MFS family permease
MQEKSREMAASESKMSKYAWKVMLFVLFAWVFDAADGVIYALTLPLIRDEFGLSLSQMGMIGSVFLFGAVAGSIIIPLIADRKGRRVGMVTCISLYSLFSGLTGLAQNFIHVIVARFFTGCGTGGEWPVGAAYLTEVVPANKRGFAMGCMQAGYPIGYFIAGAIFAVAISWNLGWRSCYYVLLIPAIFCVFVLSHLKESDRWLQAKAERIKAQEAGNIEEKKISYRELLKSEYRKPTIIATILHICGGFYSWGLVMWFPTILMLDFHIDKMTTASIIMFMWAIATFGYIFAGPISDRIGRRSTMAIFVTISLLSVIYLNYLKTQAFVPLSTMYIIAVLIGLGMGAHTILISYSTEIFPSYVRSVGVGFAIAVGKAAGMAAPALMGAVADKYSVAFGLLIAVIVGFGMVPAMFFGPETAGKSLEEIVQ